MVAVWVGVVKVERRVVLLLLSWSVSVVVVV